MAATMHAKDTISASQAECYITIEGNRYNFMQAINLEANFEKKKTEVPILGKPGRGNKSTGWAGTGSATFHYNTSIFRRLMQKYETSAVGRQTVILKDCNVNGGILTKFDADADYLDEELDFTFEDFDMPETFNLLDGML